MLPRQGLALMCFLDSQSCPDCGKAPGGILLCCGTRATCSGNHGRVLTVVWFHEQEGRSHVVHPLPPFLLTVPLLETSPATVFSHTLAAQGMPWGVSCCTNTESLGKKRGRGGSGLQQRNSAHKRWPRVHNVGISPLVPGTTPATRNGRSSLGIGGISALVPRASRHIRGLLLPFSGGYPPNPLK